MSKIIRPCHGTYVDLKDSSEALRFRRLTKGLWYLENKGLKTAAKEVVDKMKRNSRKTKGASKAIAKKSVIEDGEVLNLQPGEWVEVKSEEEILATLDQRGEYNWRGHKGLSWMPGMAKFCGKKFKVYKRLKRVLLESTGELRTLKNTVLLDGTLCDGKEFFDCDRSCYHWWREIWLRRVE